MPVTRSLPPGASSRCSYSRQKRPSAARKVRSGVIAPLLPLSGLCQATLRPETCRSSACDERGGHQLPVPAKAATTRAARLFGPALGHQHRAGADNDRGQHRCRERHRRAPGPRAAAASPRARHRSRPRRPRRARRVDGKGGPEQRPIGGQVGDKAAATGSARQEAATGPPAAGLQLAVDQPHQLELQNLFHHASSSSRSPRITRVKAARSASRARARRLVTVPTGTSSKSATSR